MATPSGPSPGLPENAMQPRQGTMLARTARFDKSTQPAGWVMCRTLQCGFGGEAHETPGRKSQGIRCTGKKCGPGNPSHLRRESLPGPGRKIVRNGAARGMYGYARSCRTMSAGSLSRGARHRYHAACRATGSDAISRHARPAPPPDVSRVSDARDAALSGVVRTPAQNVC